MLISRRKPRDLLAVDLQDAGNALSDPRILSNYVCGLLIWIRHLGDLFVDLIKQNHEVTIQPLLNLNNIFYINNILDWWHNWVTINNIDCISIDPVMMFRPYHMTVQNLPVQYRVDLVHHLKTALEHPMLITSHPGLRDYIQGMLSFAQTTEIVYLEQKICSSFTVQIQQTDRT